MNLRDFEYIVAVADRRSFSAAADQCHVSQPTLSAQVKKLEAALGAQLFERTNKRVMPTEIGKSVIVSARRILSEIDHIKDTAETAHDPMAGRYRLGAFPTLASYLFPALVPLVREAMPKLRLVLIEEKSEALLEKLRHGQIDAAFLALPVHDDYMRATHLFDDPFFVAVSADNPLAREKMIPAHALHQHRLLLLDEGHCLRDQALEVCELMGANDDADLRATSLETLRQMVRADTGVTLMPQIAIKARENGIRYIPFKDEAPFRSIGLICRKTCARPKVFDAVVELAKAARRTIDEERA